MPNIRLAINGTLNMGRHSIGKQLINLGPRFDVEIDPPDWTGEFDDVTKQVTVDVHGHMPRFDEFTKAVKDVLAHEQYFHVVVRPATTASASA